MHFMINLPSAVPQSKYCGYRSSAALYQRDLKVAATGLLPIGDFHC
jgi:hypothetical protein